MKTFRLIWEPVADHVQTAPHRVVTWYESELRLLRLSYDVDRDVMRLYVCEGAHRWLPVEVQRWPDMSPRERAHRARAVLLAERDKRFPERPPLVVTPLPGCRGRLRTVPAGGR